MIHPLIIYVYHDFYVNDHRLNSNELWQLEWGIQCRMNKVKWKKRWLENVFKIFSFFLFYFHVKSFSSFVRLRAHLSCFRQTKLNISFWLGWVGNRKKGGGSLDCGFSYLYGRFSTHFFWIKVDQIYWKLLVVFMFTIHRNYGVFAF